MKRVLVLGFCILMIIGISGCVSQTERTEGAKKDTIVIGLESDIFGFAPWIETFEITTQGINYNVFDALVKSEGTEKKIVPSLAESWENPNQLTWRFHLRKGVKFHNGDDLDAEDVKYTFDYILQDSENPFNELLSPIERVEVVDNYTVDIITKKPYPSLLTNLFEIFIVSKEHVESGKKSPVGTGAYKVKEYVKNDHIILERFEDYWGEKPEIKTAIFKIIPDNEERINSLLSGRLDIVKQVPVEKYEELKNNDKVELHFSMPDKVTFLDFDFRENNSYGFPNGRNPTSDVRVRKAIYHAIDIDRVINVVMNGLAEPASQFVTPNIFGYNPDIKRLPYDLKKAKQLMKEAGYEEGFSIEMDCPSDLDVNYVSICKEIVNQLADININVTLNIQPKADMIPKILSRNTSLCLLGWVIDVGDAQQIYDYFLYAVNEEEGVGSLNVGYYSNPEVERLGRESAKIMDPEKRLKAMQRGFKIAMDDVRWVPLLTPKVIAASSPELEWKIASQGQIRLDNIKFK
ncbi:MAG: ABC transporter substrate-binding protein [Candidatus Aenigmarchaeota archaeon]|nr:ABC transporter substrate-binding protein [Candidatus Aenigmarchaeota archaeon]